MEVENLTIEHLIPYLDHELRLIDLSSLKHIPTTMILEGFDLHLKDKPIIAERCGWSLEEIKPRLHPLSDLTKEMDFGTHKSYPMQEFYVMYGAGTGSKIQFEKDYFNNIIYTDYKSLSYETVSKLFEWHFDVFGLIEKGLAIDINTLK